MHFDEATIFNLIHAHGYAMIIALTVVSSVGIPVPEETTVLLAGWSAHEGVLTYPGVLASCIFAALCGDHLGYWIGRTGGHALLIRHGRYVGITPAKVARFHRFFERYGATTVFFARFIAGLRFLSGPLSGSAEMPYRRFAVFNAMGVVLWATVMTQLGFHFGGILIHFLERAKWAVLGAILLGALFLLVRKLRRKS